METSKVYIHKNKEGMWEVGVVLTQHGPDENGQEQWWEAYLNKHESSTWLDAMKWVQVNYVV